MALDNPPGVMRVARTAGWVVVVLYVLLLLGAGALRLADAFQEPRPTDAQAATAFFGAIYLFSLGKGVQRIRSKEVHLHREWMIRAFALASASRASGSSSRCWRRSRDSGPWLSIACPRFFAISASASSQEMGSKASEPGAPTFGTSFWLGFGVNLLVAEVWIHHTRVTGRSTWRFGQRGALASPCPNTSPGPQPAGFVHRRDSRRADG